MKAEHVLLTGEVLTIDQVISIAYGWNDGQGMHFPEVSLDTETQGRLRKRRQGLEDRIDKEIMYGVNTGCGSNKNVILTPEQLDDYQEKYIRAHCCGMGDSLPIEVVRAMMALRVNSFAKGNSGVRLELCQTLLKMLNKGVIPVVPSEGSVGASGDLIPLSHIGSVFVGEPGAFAYADNDSRKVFSAKEAMEASDIDLLPLKAKEAMALTNGSTMILSISALAIHEAVNLVKLADIITALSLEAIRGETNAFDARIHKARAHSGQLSTAENIRDLIAGSKRTTEIARLVNFPHESVNLGKKGEKIPRVQDSYAFRCVPQIHGATKHALAHFIKIINTEINSSTDNPLIFPHQGDDPDKKFDVLSGGNFHGQILAIPVDYLAIALAELANVSDRRIYGMLDSRFSYGLHDNLSGDENANTGFMIAQYATASRVSANKVLCHPASVDSIPTSAGQEDHVSMGSVGAIKLRQVIDNVYKVLAVEYLAACQAISLGDQVLKEKSLAPATEAAYQLLRGRVPAQDADRFLKADMDEAYDLIKSHDLVGVVEEALGKELAY